ncbi:MAG: hypothetical protein K8F60_05000 [Melioribacteraceae bacterium]|nr:hypothetical protein [Melioribacteraceae bacterium]
MITTDKEFFENYKLIIKISTAEDKHPGIIGNKNPRNCRFYNHKDNPTTFKKDAHVVPEGIGNRRLLSYHECDYCNEYFGNSIEDDFNKYFGPYRTLHQIKGKKGTPTYQPKKGGDRIEFDAETNSLLASLNFDNIEINENEKTLKLRTVTQPFKYINVYKCLLKIALTIIPEEELQYLEDSLKFLTDEYKYDELFPVNITNTGDRGIEHIELYIFKRKVDDCKTPYYLFILRFKSIIIQTYLYINSLDVGNKLTTYFLKEVARADYSKATRLNLNMNNYDIRTDVNVSNFSFNSSKDLPEFIEEKIKKFNKRT